MGYGKGSRAWESVLNEISISNVVSCLNRGEVREVINQKQPEVTDCIGWLILAPRCVALGTLPTKKHAVLAGVFGAKLGG